MGPAGAPPADRGRGRGVATSVRVGSVILFLGLILFGLWLVYEARDRESVSATELVLRGWVPAIVGFVFGWAGLNVADRLEFKPCPRCGRPVRVGTYLCLSCGLDLGRGATRQPGYALEDSRTTMPALPLSPPRTRVR